MGWFWENKKPQDATTDLDPSLRDFLDKETARQQAAVKSSTPPTKTSQTGPQLNESTLPTQQAAETTNNGVPPESLFQDGRYAHLWKTYRSAAEQAAETVTEYDKLGQIVDNMKERKAAIGRAALQNCVIEQIDQEECFRSGSYSRLMTMCRPETKAFNRCYEMQGRFLRALGYLSMPRSAEEEERIQTHADKLYQDMLQREKDNQAAKAAGKTLSHQEPILKADEALKALGPNSEYARMRAEAIAGPVEQQGLHMFSKEYREALLARIKDMDEDEKQLELSLALADARITRDMGKQLSAVAQEAEEARQKRKDAGQETMLDKWRTARESKS